MFALHRSPLLGLTWWSLALLILQATNTFLWGGAEGMAVVKVLAKQSVGRMDLTDPDGVSEMKTRTPKAFVEPVKTGSYGGELATDLVSIIHTVATLELFSFHRDHEILTSPSPGTLDFTLEVLSIN